MTELSDFSVCTTWPVKERRIYLLHVVRKRWNTLSSNAVSWNRPMLSEQPWS